VYEIRGVGPTLSRGDPGGLGGELSGVSGERAWVPDGRIERHKHQRRREQRDPRTGTAPRAHRRTQ